VKDGVELAKEYNLPTSICRSSSSTTARRWSSSSTGARATRPTRINKKVSETQYRYPGPKPKSREIAIVMIADVVESATRTMTEPTASRIEALVHDIAPAAACSTGSSMSAT
jgi:membrane-associated HD superfamily phosphohydrolase